MFDAVSSAISSASEGKMVANKGDAVDGVARTGAQMVISVAGFKGWVLVRITVLPEA